MVENEGGGQVCWATELSGSRGEKNLAIRSNGKDFLGSFRHILVRGREKACGTIPLSCLPLPTRYNSFSVVLESLTGLGAGTGSRKRTILLYSHGQERLNN